MNNLLKIINRVLISNNLEPVNNINLESSLKDELGFDSFMLAELTVEIEEEYGVDIFKNGMVFKVSDIVKKLNG